jgi:hypothetical protein
MDKTGRAVIPGSRLLNVVLGLPQWREYHRSLGTCQTGSPPALGLPSMAMGQKSRHPTGFSIRQLPIGVNLSAIAAGSAHAPPLAEGSRIKMVPSLEREKELSIRRAETRGWLRLPGRVERPRDVFNPSVLNVRWVPGRRILLNVTPVPRPRDLRRHPIDLKRRMQRPSELGRLRAQVLPRRLG